MSKSLKDLIASDIDLVFMQLEDFGEVHKIEGKSLGVAESDTLIFARTEDLEGEKAPGSALNVDGRECTVDSWAENLGITQIALHHTRMV